MVVGEFSANSNAKEAAMELKELKKIVAGLSVAGLIGVGGLLGCSVHAGSSG